VGLAGTWGGGGEGEGQQSWTTTCEGVAVGSESRFRCAHPCNGQFHARNKREGGWFFIRRFRSKGAAREKEKKTGGGENREIPKSMRNR